MLLLQDFGLKRLFSLNSLKATGKQSEAKVSGLNSGKCKLEVAWGNESELYSFPSGHPMNSSRTEIFATSLRKLSVERPSSVDIVRPHVGSYEELLLFHTKEYVDFVIESSKTGDGFLDYGDTPSYQGVYEASLFTVGSTAFGLRQIIEKKTDHFFNPVGGLHHARRERASGFCVFNDCAIAISFALNGLKMNRVAYVDIDAHHGDGVYYGFESDERAVIGDVHEDGRYLYPGTGFSSDRGRGKAIGTKLNLPILPGSGDQEFVAAIDKIIAFIEEFSPEFIFLQCGADGLDGDPITHLKYSSKAHRYATKKLHELSHRICDGKILAMGGGGYNKENVSNAWIAVAQELSGE